MIAELETQYKTHIPFVELPFQRAQALAQEEAKYLVVYLHCPTHENTQAFVRGVLGQDEVLANLSELALLVGYSVMEWEGHSLAQQLQITTFPAVVIFLKREIVLRTMGPCTKEEFLLDWRTTLERWGGVYAEDVAWRFDRETRLSAQITADTQRHEMEEKDRKLLEELDRKRQQEADEAREKAERERMAREREEREAREKEEEARRRRQQHESASQRLPLPPPSDADRSRIATIGLKDFSGKNHTRCFWRTDRVDALLDFALAVDESACNVEGVDLMCGFPPVPLTWVPGQTTFEEIRDLVPRATIQLRRRVR